MCAFPFNTVLFLRVCLAPGKGKAVITNQFQGNRGVLDVTLISGRSSTCLVQTGGGAAPRTSATPPHDVGTHSGTSQTVPGRCQMLLLKNCIVQLNPLKAVRRCSTTRRAPL